MSSYVLDASVAAKWVLPQAGETLVPQAQRLFEDYSNGRITFLVPDLFWPELANILWKSVRSGRIPRKSAEEALSYLTDQTLPTTPSLPLLRDAFAISATFQRTAYDAIYVALAIVSGRVLLTADERLANALGTQFPIRWLGSLPS